MHNKRVTQVKNCFHETYMSRHKTDLKSGQGPPNINATVYMVYLL